MSAAAVLFATAGIASADDSAPVPARARTGTQAQGTGNGLRYAVALEDELTNIGLAPRCEMGPDAKRFSCHYLARSGMTTRDAKAIATCDDRSATVYVYVPNILTAPRGTPTTMPLLQRLMELNWQMLIGKFEWNPQTGEVRLSAVLNTDSNFDRRSLRSIIAGLDSTLAKYRDELIAVQKRLAPAPE